VIATVGLAISVEPYFVAAAETSLS
jgi:hypothetical protein